MAHKLPHIQKLLEDRYYLRDERGNLLESDPVEMFDRVAITIAEAEKTNKQEWSEKFSDLMTQNKFLPNTPVLINAGKYRPGCFSACFVLPVEDSMEGIFDAVKKAALISKAGGGVGFNFGNLREKGSLVKSTGHRSSGPISFMRVFDTMCDTISQGGVRRGAMIAILPVWHPDIEEFIEMKDDGVSFSNFNISIGITDAFMSCVEDDLMWELISPTTKEVVKKIPAKDLWNKIVVHAHKTGDPGLVFLDTINNAHPLDEKIESTNPSLAAGTKVLTSSGIFPIEELQDADFNVLTLDGTWADASCFLSGKNKELIKISLEGGAFYFATKEHRWPVLQKDGSYKKKYTSELCPGDYLAIGGSKDITYGHYGTYNEGFMVGWLYGNGYFSIKENDARYNFSFEEGIYSECCDRIMDIVQSISGNSCKITIVDNKEISVNSENLDSLFKHIGLFSTAKLPKSFWTELSSKFRMGFIDGLFSSAGDFNKNGIITLTSVHLSLLRDIADYLGFHGIKTCIEHEDSDASLKLMPYATVKFRDIFNISSLAKNNVLHRVEHLKERPIDADHIMVVDISQYDKPEDVWDIRVYDSSHSFKIPQCITGNCGEIPLRSYESCNLGSINLMAYLKQKFAPNNDGLTDSWYEFDWNKLEEDIPTMVRFLDDVIDVNPFPLPEIEKASKESRKIGLGIMGWADCLIKMKIPYDSQEACDLAEKLMQFIKLNAIMASSELGKEKGLYPLCKHEGEGFGRDRRNATLLTVAPTGTLSRIAGVSSGIEPIFAWKTHHELEGHEYDETHWAWLPFEGEDIVTKEQLPGWMKTANEIPWEWHLKMQAAFQKYVDNSISKTINLPNNATVDDVGEIYLEAWKLGLKGITIYRDGSKIGQPLNKAKEFKDTIDSLDEKTAILSPSSPIMVHPEVLKDFRKRGPVAVGVTHKVDTGKGKIYITVNYNEYYAEPVEVFIRLGHTATGTENALAEWNGRLLSLLFKHGCPIQDVMRQGNKVFSDTIFWYGKKSFQSLPQLISYLLGFTFEEALDLAGMDIDSMFTEEDGFCSTERLNGEYCYECNTYSVIGEGGCKVCTNCGYEACG